MIKHIITPKGWTTKKVSQVFEFLSTNSYSRKHMNYEARENSIFNIHYGDIHATYSEPILDLDKNEEVPVVNDDVSLPNSVSFLKDGDLVMADASEDYKGVGDTVELVNVDRRKVLAGLHTFALRDRKGDTTPGYRTYLFRHPDVSKAVKVIATGSKVYGISKTNLAKIDLILPPLPEQQKIAKILSTWDKAIDKLSQLIVIKEQRKKGLMQVLLTGRKRFAGFKDEWKYVTLGSLCSKIGDGLHSTPNYDEDGEYYFINGNNLFNNRIVYNKKTKRVTKEEYLKHKKELSDSTILLSINGTIGNIAFYNDEPVLLGKSAAFLNLKKKELKYYIAYQLNSYKINNLFQKLVTGSTIKNLGLKSIQQTKIPIPTHPEQEKIASVLSMADKEIEILKKEMVSLKEQKKGLMQVLLTGKKRVNTKNRNVC